ncbi:MAG: hypothetical protein K6T31_06800, partial [Alicyclobacillus sp.]|nr:hypothetical protein [Alicyclobacillus sp.]
MAKVRRIRALVMERPDGVQYTLETDLFDEEIKARPSLVHDRVVADKSAQAGKGDKLPLFD